MPNEPFDQFFSSIFSKQTDIPNSTASQVGTIDIIPYIKRIKELQQQVLLLAANCACMSPKRHEQNSDHWIELTITQVRKRNG